MAAQPLYIRHARPYLPFPQDNTLALLASPKSSRAVQSSAAELLLRLLAGLQRSLALAADPELARSAYGDDVTNGGDDVTRGGGGAGAGAWQAAGAGAAAPRAGDMVQQLLASVRGADPTCPDSYPRLPLPPAGAADAWRALAAGEEDVVDVTSAVHSIALQV